MEYTAKIIWQKLPLEKFIDNKYCRTHNWHFDGGTTVLASSSSQVIPVPMSDDNAVDPEEAFVASASSCHMLWFLHIAAKNKFVVTSYSDNAIGLMAKNDKGRFAMTKITLNPNVEFDGNIPSHSELENMHETAHDNCYIANSIKAEIEIIINKSK